MLCQKFYFSSNINIIKKRMTMDTREIKNIDDLNEKVKTNRSMKDAIRMKCLDCCCYQFNEIKACTISNCPLYPFRNGKNPFINSPKRELTEEQKEVLRERLRALRKGKKSEE